MATMRRCRGQWGVDGRNTMSGHPGTRGTGQVVCHVVVPGGKGRGMGEVGRRVPTGAGRTVARVATKPKGVFGSKVCGVRAVCGVRCAVPPSVLCR